MIVQGVSVVFRVFLLHTPHSPHTATLHTLLGRRYPGSRGTLGCFRAFVQCFTLSFFNGLFKVFKDVV